MTGRCEFVLFEIWVHGINPFSSTSEKGSYDVWGYCEVKSDVYTALEARYSLNLNRIYEENANNEHDSEHFLVHFVSISSIF